LLGNMCGEHGRIVIFRTLTEYVRKRMNNRECRPAGNDDEASACAQCERRLRVL
jgi:hypothetical protein